MRRLGLRGISPRRWRTTTLVGHDDAYPVDAVKRAWDTGSLNAVWVGDITYLRTWQGWLYLATVIDAHSRRVIGWAIEEHMRTDLVQAALQMAITLRGERPTQVVFHTDKGTQGGFNRSSQHLDGEGVDDGSQRGAADEHGGAQADAVTGSATAGAPGGARVLAAGR